MKFIEKTRWGDVEVVTSEDGGYYSKTYPPDHPYCIVIEAFKATPFILEEYATDDDLAWFASTAIHFDHLPPQDIKKRVILEISMRAQEDEWHTECKSQKMRKKMFKFYRDCDMFETAFDAETLLESLNHTPVDEPETESPTTVE